MVRRGIHLVRYMWGKRWARFIVMGVLATLVYAVLGIIFVRFCGLPVLVGNGLAYLLSFFFSYAVQKLYTFRHGGGHTLLLLRYAAAQGVGLALNAFIVNLLMQKFRQLYEFAMFVAVVLVPPIVYCICKYWVFKQNKAAAARREQS